MKYLSYQYPVECFLMAMVLWGALIGRAETSERSESIRERLPEPEVGACVLVIDGGETVFKQGFGVASLESNMPCTPATNFRMGSVSKQFTATAILLLVDQGKLGLDTTLGDVFHESPPFWDDMTIHHLLTHTSGVPDYFVPGGLEFQLSDQDILTQQLDLKKPRFSAGERWEYCNAGYVLLGLTVEQISGMAFHHFVDQQIFSPLGMDDSRIYYRGRNGIPNRAYGHVREGEGWVLGDQSLTSALRGDGSLYASLNDMEKWIYGVLGASVLSKDLHARQFAPHDQSANRYGYGWFIDSYRGLRRVGHGGATRGFRTYLQIFPDERSAVLIQVNTESGGLRELAEQIMDVLLED